MAHMYIGLMNKLLTKGYTYLYSSFRGRKKKKEKEKGKKDICKTPSFLAIDRDSNRTI
jgi:hypothetical protein